jgi:mannose-1-phosphate guanylyltransferase/phosphomannomutase
VLRHVPDDRPYDFSKELFPHLLEMGRPIYGHVLDGYWQDVGTLEQFRQANFDALDGAVQLDDPRAAAPGNVWVSEEVDIDQLEPSSAGVHRVNSRIATGASIGAYTVLSRGVIVREGRARDAHRRRRGTYIGPQRRRRGRDHRPRLRRARPRPRPRGRRDRRPGHDRAGGEHLPGRPRSTRSRRSRPARRSTRASSGRRAREHAVRPDGATGLVNVDLTPETAVRLAAALGTALRRGSASSRAAPPRTPAA